ncbi:MAG: alpha/beta hydrolase [Pseudomonadales bacterium]|nr:alpha/beta hydrolase [Pseudomonadales bacterium]MDP6471262.1 alpha/beta hydrolase [Pseudomonadales bacterium]MDP6825549.1 alpha/beta hydrolase [Pseudomonadales bacterium]MDP6972916.1 alpha/beta hydrolase [Pseudomonadales bacterium]
MSSSNVEGVTFQHIDSNGIRMRLAVAGDGPVVLLAHGWPESWYSWRHQLRALSEAGYRAVAPDMRGYGETDAPKPVEAYDIATLAADMVGVLDALGVDQAHMVGHDWGAPVATHTVITYPDRFASLTLLSVPHGERSPVEPISAIQQAMGENFYYMLYHNEPGGVAEAEYDSDPRAMLSRIYLSPDSPREEPEITDPKRSAGGFVPRLGAPRGLPGWLTQEDLDYYVVQFEHAGFRGGVNYYRNIGRNWEITADLGSPHITVPTLFIAGEFDIVIAGADVSALKARMSPVVDDLREVILIPGVGHWVQQEAAEETNTALLGFLASLDD